MKVKLVLLSVLMALIAFTSDSYALSYRDSSQKTLLQTPLNGFVQGTTVQAAYNLLAGQGQTITGIAISNGATAGIISLYDASTASGFNSGGSLTQGGPLECVFESQVAANTANYIDLSNAPINTNQGVLMVTTGTVGAVIYTGAGQVNR